MTFIVNILHAKFSLLVADTRISISKPYSREVDGGTLMLRAGDHIDGHNKIYLSPNRNAAVGCAGYSNAHDYTYIVEQSNDVNWSLHAIEQHVIHYLQTKKRRELLTSEIDRNNEGIFTFYDDRLGQYFSNIYRFNKGESYTRICAAHNSDACMLSIGLTDLFVNTISQEKIHAFISSLKSADQIPDCLDWLTMVFRKMSKVNNYLSAEFDAWLSTRDYPIFRLVTNTPTDIYAKEIRRLMERQNQEKLATSKIS